MKGLYSRRFDKPPWTRKVGMGVDDSASKSTSGRLNLPDRPLGVSCGLRCSRLGHSLPIYQLEASKHYFSVLRAGWLVLFRSSQDAFHGVSGRGHSPTHDSATKVSFLQAHLAFARCWLSTTSPHGVEVSCK